MKEEFKLEKFDPEKKKKKRELRHGRDEEYCPTPKEEQEITEMMHGEKTKHIDTSKKAKGEEKKRIKKHRDNFWKNADQHELPFKNKKS